MVLVLMRYSINGQNGSDYIINTRNIESFIKVNNADILKFRVYITNGEYYDFNQLYFNGDFVSVHKMEQLYKLLSKLDSGVIQDGSA